MADTYMAMPGSDYLEGLRQLHRMLAPDVADDEGGLSTAGRSADTLQSSPGQSSVANDPNISTAYLRDKFQGEALDKLAGALGVGDKNEAARQSVYLNDYDRQEAQDPNSYTNAGKDALLDQTSRNTAQRSMGQAEMAARAQQIKEAGQLKESEAYGGTYGTARGQDSVPAQHVADMASTRHINESVAPVYANAGLVPSGPMAGNDANGASGGQTDMWLADQAQRDPKILAQLGSNPAQKARVDRILASRGVSLEDLTNQALARSEMAKDVLPQLDMLGPMADQLAKEGWMQPGAGQVRRFIAEHGMGKMVGDNTGHLGEFQTQLGVVLSAFANSHAGARGAASQGLRQAFEKLLGGNGDVQTFKGQLASIRRLLTTYSDANAPVTGGVRQTYDMQSPQQLSPSGNPTDKRWGRP